MTLLLDLVAATGLSAQHKARIVAALSTRISRHGVLRIVAQRHRTQAANWREASERLLSLLRTALQDEPARTPTRPPRAAQARRLADKHRCADRTRARRAARGEA